MSVESAKGAYVCGDIDVEELERRIGLILQGRSYARIAIGYVVGADNCWPISTCEGCGKSWQKLDRDSWTCAEGCT